MEEWKDVEGYEGLYKISNLGRVVSLPKEIKCNANGSTYISKDKVLKGCMSVAGYKVVRLKNKFGESKLEYIHRLIGANFIAGRKDGYSINHINGIKKDNRVDNLEWVTHKQNMTHAYETGLTNRGEECAYSLLTESDVIEIRALYQKGVSQKDLGGIYNVSRSCIYKVVNYKTWKHV